MLIYHPVILILLAATSGDAVGTAGSPKKPDSNCSTKNTKDKSFDLVCFDKSTLVVLVAAAVAPKIDEKSKTITCPNSPAILSACCNSASLVAYEYFSPRLGGTVSSDSIPKACPGVHAGHQS
ncbi:hypothetical protein PGT21_028743 [Puccinia graminis f. sp. tritici]|uniref:Hydrophobin n=1 Tax=Puccinia graminis f. sp. tritici TaxID=56615 RepID=A0A5B0M7C6_PUCGR|nr:hypothetical protein PGT21_028743 [Puccinia graminis f. sp. tritici]KAA1135249.1 hypothetical protein PGTUg99_022023 [Puccinia graminis f. sp. tritici]